MRSGWDVGMGCWCRWGMGGGGRWMGAGNGWTGGMDRHWTVIKGEEQKCNLNITAAHLVLRIFVHTVS